MSAIPIDSALWRRIYGLSYPARLALEVRANRARGMRVRDWHEAPQTTAELQRAGLLTPEGDIVPAYLDAVWDGR